MSCKDCGLCRFDLPFWEHETPDGVFIKQMLMESEGTVVPQHAHVYDHTSMLATGSVRVYVGDELLGEYKAPTPIFIKAKVKHTIVSLEKNTLIYCIHKLRDGVIPIHAEHQLP